MSDLHSAPPAATGLDATPLLKSERTWRGGTLLSSSTSTAVATWCFVVGGTVAYYLDLISGALAMMAGILIGIGAILVSIVPVATKYGVDSALSSKAFMGSRGWYFSVILMFLTLAGWNTVLVVILGRAVAQILVTAGLVAEGSRGTVEVVAMLASLVVVWGVIRGGANALATSAKWIALGVLALSVMVLALLIHNVGVEGLLAAEPQAPFESQLANVTISMEAFIATAIAWWPYVGGMVRLVPSARTALWPSIFGLAVPLAGVAVIGLCAGLVIPESGGDPTTFLADVGGLFFGIVSLVFITLANIGSTMVGTFAAAVGVRQIPAVSRRVSWSTACALSLVPTAILAAFFADAFLANLQLFLAGCALFLAPYCGMQAVDFFFLRRQRLDVRALYTDGKDNPYRFWLGVNPAAIVGLVAGISVFLLLLNPVTYETKAFFAYTTASVPSMVAAGGAYWLCALVVRRRGRGGYDYTSPESAAVGAVPAPRNRGQRR